MDPGLHRGPRPGGAVMSGPGPGRMRYLAGLLLATAVFVALTSWLTGCGGGRPTALATGPATARATSPTSPGRATSPGRVVTHRAAGHRPAAPTGSGQPAAGPGSPPPSPPARAPCGPPPGPGA